MHHFRKRCRFRHLKTWTQLRQGNFLIVSCDYTLGTDRRLFEIVGISDIRNYSSDHFVLRAHLLQRPMQSHYHYLWGRRVFPLSLLAATYLSMACKKF